MRLSSLTKIQYLMFRCIFPEFLVLCSFCFCVRVLSRVRLFASPWPVAHQAPLSMGFCRQEYWSGLPFPSPRGSSRSRDGTRVSCISGRRFTLWATGRKGSKQKCEFDSNGKTGNRAVSARDSPAVSSQAVLSTHFLHCSCHFCGHKALLSRTT